MSLRKNFIEKSDLVQKIHGPILPSDVRQEDGLKANLLNESNGKSSNVDVWRISPLGIEIIKPLGIEITPGDSVTVSISTGGQFITLNGLTVDVIESLDDKTIIGIRLTYDDNSTDVSVEKRGNARWLTSEHFLPTGMATNPMVFDDSILFRVKDISSVGMQIVTSLRNKFVLTGIVFESSFSFPMSAQVNAKIKVENVRVVRENTAEYLSIGVVFIDPNKDLLHAIGQYIAQFSNTRDISSLHREGLGPNMSSQMIQFSYVKSEQDYKDVLELRYLANKAEKKLKYGATPENMGDLYDTRSRIVIGRFAGKLVVSARMTFSDSATPMEHESFVEWNKDLPRRENSIEIMKACTHPEFQGNNLFFLMWKYMCLPIVQSGRKWIIMSTTDKYLPMYRKMGGIETGIYYKLPAYDSSEDQMILGDIRSGLLGKGVNPLVWNHLYGDLFDYMETQGQLSMSTPDRLRVKSYALLSPVSKAFVKHFVNPKRLDRARSKSLSKRV